MINLWVIIIPMLFNFNKTSQMYYNIFLLIQLCLSKRTIFSVLTSVCWLNWSIPFLSSIYWLKQINYNPNYISLHFHTESAENDSSNPNIYSPFTYTHKVGKIWLVNPIPRTEYTRAIYLYITNIVSCLNLFGPRKRFVPNKS